MAERSRVLSAALLVLALAGCSPTGGGGNLLGGREKCWPADPPRGASIWSGLLRVEETAWLETAEGDVIRLLPGTLTTAIISDGSHVLLKDHDVIAYDMDYVTLFGGMGSDGALVMCALESIDPPE